jgi:hypothetical protein
MYGSIFDARKKLTQEVVLELHQLIFENKCNNNHVIISIGSLTRHEKRGQESNNRNNNFSRAHKNSSFSYISNCDTVNITQEINKEHLY